MVAAVYWYLFLIGDTNPITIDGDNFSLVDAPLTHEHDADKEGGVVNTHQMNSGSASGSADESEMKGTRRVENMV